VEEKLVGVSGAALRVAEAGNGVLSGTVHGKQVVVSRECEELDGRECWCWCIGE
jgi:hypothetical protein